MSSLRQPQSVLVTGGCGFIGSAFVRYLFRLPEFTGKVVNFDLLTYAANPDNVKGSVDAGRYTFVQGDIGDAELVARVCREHAVDTLVHFAAESHVDRSIVGPGAFIQANIVGTYQLLEVVRAQSKIHFHHVSTDEVYGSLGATGLFTETTPYDPSSPYSASKAASDHLVRAYTRTYGLSTTLSNCSNNYGPYQFPEKLIPLMILNLLEGKSLPVYGTGANVRDWLYVDDHAEAIWTIVRNGKRGETYNVGGEAEWANLALLHKLIEVVAKASDRDAEVLKKQITFVADRPGHDARYAIDCSKLKRELAWSQRHDIESGLLATVRWYLENPEWVARVKSGAYREWLDKNYSGRG
ncbi:MAG TPA: dTDP-glucose 4,6-dehydratase [Polyangiaceae bacterium]|jgi:dTDP-glucose 4,6-dehydratase|nr:dTDP-glucose 4,6-dehydratase [Polyangiaceae bacterium]